MANQEKKAAQFESKLAGLPVEEELAAEAREIEAGLANCDNRRNSPDLVKLNEEVAKKKAILDDLEKNRSKNTVLIALTRKDYENAAKKADDFAKDIDQQEE